MSDEVTLITTEAEMIVTRKSQVNDNTIPGEADDDDTKPVMTTSPAGITVSSSEAPQTFPSAGTSDRQSSEVGLEPTNRASSMTSDNRLAPPPCSSEDARDVAEKSNGCGVSCVRDLINSAIEKTLQDPVEQRRSQTPPAAVSGNVLILMLSLVKAETVLTNREGLCDCSS